MPRFTNRRSFGGFRRRKQFGGFSGGFGSRNRRRSFGNDRPTSYARRFLRRRRPGYLMDNFEGRRIRRRRGGYSMDNYERRRLRRRIFRRRPIRKPGVKSIRSTTGGLLTKDQIISKTRLHITNLHPKVSNEELKVRKNNKCFLEYFYYKRAS